MPSRTPFGNPDGSRSDIQEVIESFVFFDDIESSTDPGISADDLSVRVIVGAKGSGKTMCLRRLRAAATQNESIYADVVQQDLPVTSGVVKFCQCFRTRDLTEKWMQLWYCAIVRSLASHILHAKQLSMHLTPEHREELEAYPGKFVPRVRRHVSVYSQVTEIINRHHTEHAYSKYFDDTRWAELASTLGEIIYTMPPIYFFIDSVDEEYGAAPMFWLQCQKGLFFRAMRFLRDPHFGGRLHVVVCIRDHVLASVLRSEHQNRYRGEPHITTLCWGHEAASFFLNRKIEGLDPTDLMDAHPDRAPDAQQWLGYEVIENKGRAINEPIVEYLLRHTRLLPRDIVILGNRLTNLIRATKRKGLERIPAREIRRCVREVAASFGNEQLAICANQIASSSMPADAARQGYSEIYTGDSEYARGVVDELKSVVKLIGKDRFNAEDLELAVLQAREYYGDESDALSVLWQNRLLGYVDTNPDGPGEVFFSELHCDDFNLPLDKIEYLLHSCLIDSVGISAVGPPVIGSTLYQFPETDSSSVAKPLRRATTNPVAESVDGLPLRIGAYPIERVIGSGGMGLVFLARDLRLRREIALKVIPEDTPQTLERFEREAQILAALNHPNIATIYSLEEEEGEFFITMEYVSGHTLADRLEEKRLELKTARIICLQIAQALEAAHRKGVIHRDLKPLNVMVTDEERVKVLDFGIAKRIDNSIVRQRATANTPTSTGLILGTLGYMSPEQLRGERADHRSDIWSFGCCLFECLAGRPAFREETATETIAATLGREPDWSAVRRAPRAIRNLLRQSLEKDRQARLDNVGIAISALRG